MGLWQRTLEVTGRALASGALLPIATLQQVVTDGGVDFLVRVASSLGRKDDERARVARGTARGPKPNPFLPYDEALHVADLSETHVALLNKFNVVEHHLLIVTRAFADQGELLTAPDFDALWAALREIDGLGFYNGGPEAGASQAHKHLQLVPLPFAAQGPRVPTEPALRQGALPFTHAFAPHAPGPPPSSAGAWLRQRYLELLARAGRPPRPGEARQPGPYNLLLTREWMLVVPRVAEHFGTVSLNGLAFAGSLFVRDEAELSAIREAGPLCALQAVVGS